MVSSVAIVLLTSGRQRHPPNPIATVHPPLLDQRVAQLLVLLDRSKRDILRRSASRFKTRAPRSTHQPIYPTIFPPLHRRSQAEASR